MIFILILFAISKTLCSPLYGPNLLINHDFSLPDLTPYMWAYFQRGIPGWNCSMNCQIDSCPKIKYNFLVNYGIYFGDCYEQILDLSSNYIQTISQVFYTTNDPHKIHLTFLFPSGGANHKSLLVSLNQQLVINFRPLTYDTKNHTLQAIIYPKFGINNLSITQNGPNDTQGFRLIQVSLYPQINTTFVQIMGAITNNTVTQIMVEIPGARVLFGYIINSFVSFDRLQFYYYHNRIISDYTKIFLKAVTNLMDLKGNLNLKIQEKIFGNPGVQQTNFIANQEYKTNYIYVEGLSKAEDGFGFVTNNCYFLAYSIPFLIFILIFLHFLFRATNKWKISLLVRKYDFLGIGILLVCQGNIQQFTFYAVGQFLTYFSLSFSHKIINIFILQFYFFIFFSAISLFLIFKISYSKNIRYLMENSKGTWLGIAGYTVDQGVICILFGSAHQILLHSSNYQLAILGFIEVFWLSMQIPRLISSTYQYHTIVWFGIIEGCLRIIFQISLYTYSLHYKDPKLKIIIGDIFQLTLIFIFIIIWILQFCYNLYIFIYQLSIFIRDYKKIPSRQIVHQKKIHKQLKKIWNYIRYLKQ